MRVLVRDSDHFPVPGALIAVKDERGAVLVYQVSDSEGGASIDIAAGVYTISVELDGFRTVSQANVALTAGQTAHVAAVLVPDIGIDEHVTVSVDVTHASTAGAATRPTGSITPADVQRMPRAEPTIRELLPLIPGVVRWSTGELSLTGLPEQHAALLINGMNAADPGTGELRMGLPVDSIDSVEVFLHPYGAEHGRFTSGITVLETRPGSDAWHFEVNDFIPDFRVVRGRIRGIAEDTPHMNLRGPVLKRRVFLSQSLEYTYANRPVRGLDFPTNETHTESASLYTQVDVAANAHHTERITLSYANTRNEFVGLDVFRPRPVTPNTYPHDASVMIRDTSEVAGGLLGVAASIGHYGFGVAGQGDAEQTITPTKQLGNYFWTERRDSTRTEVSAVYTLRRWQWLGRQEIRVGTDLHVVASVADIRARPVNVVRLDGTPAERIEFEAAPAIEARNREYTAFLQDHWMPRANVTIDGGVRYEDQQIAGGRLLAPRIGVAWSPGESSATVVRGGIGAYNDGVPLNIRQFSGYPTRTISKFARDGATILDERCYANLLLEAPRSSTWPTDQRAETALVPQNLSTNIQLDRRINPWLTLRVDASISQTSNLYIVTPAMLSTGGAANLLSAFGHARYRALEVTGRVGPPKRAVNVSYTRSRAMGDLNELNRTVGDLASPLIRPNQYSREPFDVPHRALAWGELPLPRRITVAPLVEVRSGFPYTVLDEEQYAIGLRNDDAMRYPLFFAMDMQLSKDLQVLKTHAVRLSVRAFNLTNHFNPRDVHANVADPHFGTFLANYRRYFVGGFDILF